MANKLALLAGAAAVIAAAGGAGGWYALRQNRDPMALAREMMARGDVRGAGLELRNAVRDQPRNAEAHYRLAEVQLLENDPIAAEREARLARKTGYDAAAANLVAAQAMLHQGRFQAVLDEFKTDGLQPAQAEPLLVTRAFAQLDLHDLPAAEASAADAERIAPQDPNAALAAGRVAAAKRDYDAAEKSVDRALALSPKMPDALLVKGQIAYAKGDRGAALAALNAVVDAAPGNVAARIERANLLMLSNDDAGSRADVEAVLKTDPRNAAARYMQGVLLIRAKDYKGADTAFQRISGQIENEPRGLYFLALDKAELGDTAQAVDAIERYVARYPSDPEGLKLLAHIDLAARQPEGVIRALSPAAKAGKADAETLDLLGQAYALKGAAPQAVQTLQQASTLAPGNTDVLGHLAAGRLMAGDAPGATSTLERSLQVKPDQPGVEQALIVTALESGKIDEAQAALDKLRAQTGDTEVVDNLTGTIRLTRFDFAGAEQQFRANVDKYPNSAQAKLNLARVLTLEDKRGDAEDVLESALKQDPANAAVLSAFTGLTLQQNQVGRAVSAVEAAHQAAPGNVGITAALSQLYVRAGDPKKALGLLGQQSGALPPVLLAARAQAQFASGDQDTARQTWRDLLSQQPKDIGLRRLLVSALVQAKKLDEAKEIVQQGLALQPGNPALLATSIAVALQAGGIPAALAEADRLRQDPTNMPAASLLKGNVLMQAGRYADAAAAFRDEYAQAPSAALAVSAANALAAAGQRNAADQQLRDWLAKHPDDPEAMRLVASLEVASGQYAQAEPKLLYVLKDHPNDPVVLNNLAWTMEEQGKPGALGYARRAYLANPNPAVADTLGWILAAHGDASSALPLLRQAAEARPKDPAVKYHLALALNDTGHKQEAIDLLNAVVGTPDTFTDKPKAQALLGQLTGKH
jgi:putative PEP-CTERM system TPR-repeat lipoprotein